MKKIIICLIMALLLAGSVEAKTPRKTKRKKATTTATTTARSRRPATPISAPTIEITDAMLDRADSQYGQSFYQSALEGSADDMAQIARYWALGDFGYKDEAEALRWFYLAAKAGNADACNNVAQAYEEPDNYGGNSVEQNYFEAAKWYAKAAALGDDYAADCLAMLVHYKDITAAELKMVNEMAGTDMSVSEASQRRNAIANSRAADSQRKPFYGTWTSARGTTFTISEGPYLDLRGAGKFKGEWTSNGELHVSFGYPDEINLRYYNGNLYDRDGRMHWRIGN